MKISLLCSNDRHPVVDSLRGWVKQMSTKGHDVSLEFDISQLIAGDILFLVSFDKIVNETVRAKYKATLVLHASDLPKGRGWSPCIWSILEGANQITVTLLEASEHVDSGPIWLKTSFALEGHELFNEINSKLFSAQLFLMTHVVENFPNIRPSLQIGEPGIYRKKRSPEDSRIDPHKSISEQFRLLRVVDSDRYPAFFEYQGHRYLIKIEKVKND